MDDRVEIEVYNTEPIYRDTDGDRLEDQVEATAEMMAAGFDPALYDEVPEDTSAFSEFIFGAACGDISEDQWGWGACGSDSYWYLAGQIASGLLGYGDLRDIPANLERGDWAGGLLAGFGLIPILGDLGKVAGDIAGIGKKAAKLSDGEKATLSRYLGSNKSGKSVSERFKELDDMFDGAATSIKGNYKVSEDQILRWARHGMDPAHMKKVLDGATEVRFADELFVLEKAAEKWWRKGLANAKRQHVDKVPAPPGAAKGTYRTQRVYDAVDDSRIPDSNLQGPGVAYELKIGRVRNATKRAKAQANADRLLMEEIAKNPTLARENRGFDKIEWVFFARSTRDGVVGPDPALLALLNEKPKIPYQIVLQP
jgi:hypothetical protein